MKLLLISQILLTLFINAYCQDVLQTQDQKGQNITFSFGSCFCKRRFNQKISVFRHIAKYNPDVFAWLGDASYTKFLEEAIPSLNFTKNEIGYRMIYDNNVTSIVGVWDDHDYGRNDGNFSQKMINILKDQNVKSILILGDKYYIHKEEVRQLFLDFLDEPKDSIRRTQPGGIYTSYYIGITKQVKLILLDVRYSRDSFWFEHEDGLGSDQWKWLEDQFEDKNCSIILLGTGIQLIPDDRIVPEKWFPKSRKRLYDLIEKHKQQKRVIVLSGDIHIAEILAEPESFNSRFLTFYINKLHLIQLIGFGYNLVEITSSGLTHSLDHTIYPMYVMEGFLPNTFNEKKHRFFGKNFAIVDILIDEKNKENTSLHFKIQDDNDKTQLEILIKPWQKNQKDLKWSDAKFTRETHYIIRWLYQMALTYYIDYPQIGIKYTVLALTSLVIVLVILRIIWKAFRSCRRKTEIKKD